MTQHVVGQRSVPPESGGDGDVLAPFLDRIGWTGEPVEFFFLVLGVAGLLSEYWFYWRRVAMAPTGVRTSGVIQRVWTASGDESAQAEITFADEAGLVRRFREEGLFGRADEGCRIDVIFPPGRPERAVIRRSTPALIIRFAALALLFLVMIAYGLDLFEVEDLLAPIGVRLH